MAVLKYWDGSAWVQLLGGESKSGGGYCSVYQNAAQGLPNTAPQTVYHDTVVAGDGYSTSTGLYTVTEPGRYLVAAATAADRILDFIFTSIYKNGTEVKRGGTMGLSNYMAQPMGAVSAVISCLAGDTLSILTTSGGASNTYPGPPFVWADFQWQSPP